MHTLYIPRIMSTRPPGGSRFLFDLCDQRVCDCHDPNLLAVRGETCPVSIASAMLGPACSVPAHSHGFGLQASGDRLRATGFGLRATGVPAGSRRDAWLQLSHCSWPRGRQRPRSGRSGAAQAAWACRARPASRPGGTPGRQHRLAGTAGGARHVDGQPLHCRGAHLGVPRRGPPQALRRARDGTRRPRRGDLHAQCRHGLSVQGSGTLPGHLARASYRTPLPRPRALSCRECATRASPSRSETGATRHGATSYRPQCLRRVSA